MKKCPSCQRTFDDSLRFCQSDGTPLVDDAPPMDPYKTMVASKDEIASAIGPGNAASDTESSVKVDEEVLQLPNDVDPRKTMYASEDEIRKEMKAHDEPLIDLPDLQPEPPKFSEPSPNPPSFGDPGPSSPPPSPFSPSLNEPIANPTIDSPFNKTTPPIPSPFENPTPSTYQPATDYKPEPFTPPAEAPRDIPSPISAGVSAPVQNWEPNEPMQSGAISPTPAAAGGQSNTLAIISLVAGILGLTVCCGSVLPNLLAIILGFMAKNKAANDPAHFGGRGLALGGLITGVIGLIGTIVIWVFVLFFNGMALIMQSAR